MPKSINTEPPSGGFPISTQSGRWIISSYAVPPLTIAPMDGQNVANYVEPGVYNSYFVTPTETYTDEFYTVYFLIRPSNSNGAVYRSPTFNLTVNPE